MEIGDTFIVGKKGYFLINKKSKIGTENIFYDCGCVNFEKGNKNYTIKVFGEVIKKRAKHARILLIEKKSIPLYPHYF